MPRTGLTVVALALTLTAAPRPVAAATAKEALKCGLAIRKLQAKQLTLLSKAIVNLCKKPEQLQDTVAKMTAALNKATAKINAKFTADTCDPDLDQIGGLPVPLLTPEAVQAQIIGVTTPLGVLCNNVDDNP